MERLSEKRLRWGRLWRSAVIRRLVFIFILAGFVSAILVWAYTAYTTNRLKEEWLARESAMLGEVAVQDPAQAAKWAKLLAADQFSPEAAETGRKLAAQYGISKSLDASLVPIVADQRTRTWQLLAAGLFVMLATLLVVLIRESRRQLGDVRRLALSLEEAVKLNRPMNFRLYGEGELGLLAHGVQELSLRLQETIAQLNRDKAFLRDTISDISHQLKTPLASLSIYVELLQNGGVGQEEADEFLRTCRLELERMEWLILTLLKIARLEAGTLPMQMAQTTLTNTVKMALEHVRRLADEKQIQLVEQGPQMPIYLSHDARWLAEALGNLLKNAVEHSPPGSNVTLAWEETPVFVRMQVSDEGLGIEERHWPHIFKKFYRSGVGSSGVGLGLPLARSIAERHGGMLSVGRSPTGGAIFTLTLPLGQLPKP